MPIQPYLNPKRPGCWVGLAFFFEREEKHGHIVGCTVPTLQAGFVYNPWTETETDYRDCSALSLSFWVADLSRYVKDNLPTLWVQVCT